MTAQLFERAAVFGDIHFGKKNNDRQFNTDCENFIKWFIEEAQAFGADTCIFVGDWHDNRHSIHLSTLNYSMSNLERLSKAFKHVYFITGNHDLFYKDKREISSVSIGRNLTNVTIVNDFLHKDGVTFCPWLVGDDWKQIPKYAKKSAYMFGHYELPNFMMNAMVEMPDHGGLNRDHFQPLQYMAFTGHFHKRQVKDKVCYVGSPFPHNFADVWDDDRGMMLLEWGKTPVFRNWEQGPRYRALKLSELLEAPELYITERTYARVTVDLEMNFEEAQFIKDTFQAQFGARKMDVVPGSKQEEEQSFADGVQFQSVDQIVIEGLSNIDSLTLDKKLLVELYRSLA